ncbi:MAG: hypothetical protein AAGB00_00380 [Planctomycetota bacterium]
MTRHRIAPAGRRKVACRLAWRTMALVAGFGFGEFCVSAVLASDAKADQGTDNGVDQRGAAVLLKNGEVLFGGVTVEGGRYRIASTGSEIWIPHEQVQKIARSLLELYDWRRGQIRPPTAGGHLRLADWCINQELWPQAAREMLSARELAPQDPRLAPVEQRLAEAWQRAQPPDVRRGGAADPLDGNLLDAARTASQLRLIEALPAGALEHFTRRVQPILVNNCTAGGCHQPGGDEAFQLNRDWVRGIGGRRSTFANLAAVLAEVDRQNPSASPLLRAAAEPHAGKGDAMFTGRRAQLHRALSQWVAGLNRPSAPRRQRLTSAPPPTYAGLIGGGFQPKPGVGRDYRFPSAGRAAASDGDIAAPEAAVSTPGTPRVGPNDGEVRPASFVETYEPLRHGGVKRGAQLKPVAPKDEFDPDVFNRQFRARSADSSTKPTSEE